MILQMIVWMLNSTTVYVTFIYDFSLWWKNCM